MNVFVGSGKVVRANLIEGGREILKFTLAIAQNYSQQEKVDYVPCIIFNPSDEAKEIISEGQEVELQGGVRTFRFEITGEVNYRTEVSVNQRSLKILN